MRAGVPLYSGPCYYPYPYSAECVERPSENSLRAPKGGSAELPRRTRRCFSHRFWPPVRALQTPSGLFQTVSPRTPVNRKGAVAYTGVEGVAHQRRQSCQRPQTRNPYIRPGLPPWWCSSPPPSAPCGICWARPPSLVPPRPSLPPNGRCHYGLFAGGRTSVAPLAASASVVRQRRDQPL